MGRSQHKGEFQIIQTEIETIINNLEERLNAHDNRITRDGFKMGEFAYASFGDLKDGVLKEMPWGSFGLFVDDWSLYEICNMNYSSESSFLEKGNKVIEMGINSSGGACVASTFDHRYSDFLVGHSTLDVAVGKLLTVFSTLEKWSRAVTFGTRH